jgi:hypothetical protein
VKKVHGDSIQVDPRESYYVDLEKCKTSAGVLDCIMQVAGKGWATDHILASLVHEIYRLLSPQANLCSMGQEKGPIDIKKVIKERL